MKIRPVLYPFFLAVFPIVSLYAKNALEVDPRELTRPLVLALFASGIAFLLIRLMIRDWHRAGLVAGLAVIYFNTIEQSPAGVAGALTWLSWFWVHTNFEIEAFWAAILPETLLYVLLTFLAVKKVAKPRAWTPILNVFTLILVVLPAMEVAQTGTRVDAAPGTELPSLGPLPETTRRPDIYYIILDSFARADVLKEEFGYDLEPFLHRLEEKGFFVARRSTSNYCQTPLSISSSLNGAYLKPATAPEERIARPDPILFRQNAVFRALKPLGYRFVTFASGFDFTEDPETDYYFSPFTYLSNFHRMILDGTPAHYIYEGLEERNQYTLARERTLYLLDTLPEVTRISAPTFTFAHVLSPHPPFVFGADGEDVSPRNKNYQLSDGDLFHRIYGEKMYIPGYRAQVEFLVKRIERTIDAILARSPEPPIIILQSDHGAGLHLDMGRPDKTDHHERMSILNAYYLPGGKREGLTDWITPVNSFRVVFNDEFGAHLPLLPEENYYSSWPEPFSFVRVTDKVRPAEAGPIPAADPNAAPQRTPAEETRTQATDR